VRSPGHQPGEPAGRGVVEVFVEVVGEAPQVSGQVDDPEISQMTVTPS
jgi:hypothetical protein